MISFYVKLLKVPPLDKMSGWDVFELMVNASHVAGDFWIYEGDEEAIDVSVEVVAEGVTEGTGDMSREELVEHCDEIFGVDLSDEPASWKMLNMKA